MTDYQMIVAFSTEKPLDEDDEHDMCIEMFELFEHAFSMYGVEVDRCRVKETER